MTKQFKFKTILPNGKELERIEQLEFQLDFDADKEMLNHIEIFKPNHKIDVDVEGNILTISYRHNWHYSDVSGTEVAITGMIVPKLHRFVKRSHTLIKSKKLILLLASIVS